MVEKDRQRVTDAIRAALLYASGGTLDIEYTIAANGVERIVKAKGKSAVASQQSPENIKSEIPKIKVVAKKPKTSPPKLKIIKAKRKFAGKKK